MNEVRVVVYFADDPSRAYQLLPWLDVLQILHAVHPVAIVVRDSGTAAVVRARTSLPVLTAPSFSELTALYAALDAGVALYCNNSRLNFESLVESRLLHVHIGHGESDKQSMASNNAKAYDRVFVAGEAAVRRHLDGLLEFDGSTLVRIGRPQLDLRPASVLTPTASRTVLYAPTWEGDAEYNDYTSVDTMGVEIARAILAVPGARLVYMPHPQVAASTTAAVRAGHLAILDLVRAAERREPDAGHTAILAGNILAVMPDCDAMVTDVSSVGLDWLYLRTEQPIFITDRRQDPDRFRTEVTVSRCADVIDTSTLPGLTALLTARLEYDEHHLARVAMRHHYFDDLQLGDSTARFLESVAELVSLRDRLLGTAPASEDPDAAIIA